MKSQKALEKALEALEDDKKKVDAQQEKLAGQIAELRNMVGRVVTRRAVSKKVAKKASRKKRRLSAAGRKAISDAMKKRWAERRKAGK